jgi:hypothetical protein
MLVRILFGGIDFGMGGFFRRRANHFQEAWKRMPEDEKKTLVEKYKDIHNLVHD